MLEGHISRAFDGDLVALHYRVIERSVPASDYDTSIERDQLSLIVRRQPVSRDLRAIFALAKSATQLDRIGDLACLMVDQVRSIVPDEEPLQMRNAVDQTATR